MATTPPIGRFTEIPSAWVALPVVAAATVTTYDTFAGWSQAIMIEYADSSYDFATVAKVVGTSHITVTLMS